MGSYKKISGNIGKIEVRTTKTGRKVANLSIAQHNEDGSTTWHDTYTFDPYRLAMIQNGSLAKGDLVRVAGTEIKGEFVHKETGEVRYTTKLQLTYVEVLARKAAKAPEPAVEPQAEPAPEAKKSRTKKVA